MIRAGLPLAVALFLGIAVTAMAGPALAQNTRPPAARPQANDQPIEIISDSLEVQQDKQVAVFTGNVDAVQGDMRLKADQLRVHYRQEGNNAQAARPARTPAPSDPATMNSSIDRIEAFGNVFVSSSTETGQGDQGVYDVARRTIVLEGKQVVLTRGQNVLRGSRMVMNLDTVNSTMEAAPSGRVRMLMVPEKKAN